MALKGTTKRSLDQVILRHTPESLINLEEFNIYGRIKEIRGEPDTDINRDILLRKIVRFVDTWAETSGGRIKGFDDHIQADSIIAIRPGLSDPDYSSVYCDVFPLAFRCVNKECAVFADSTKSDFIGVCKRCGSALVQLKYVWFHACGRLIPFGPLTQIKCPRHGRDALYLMDTGRFATSRWRCRDCNYEQGLGMIPCTDEGCKSKRDTTSENRFMMASVWNDSWVYYTQQLSFVNLSGSEIDNVVASSSAKQLLLDSLTGRIPSGSSHLSTYAEGNVQCVTCNAKIPFTARFCLECGTRQATTSSISEADRSSEVLAPDSDLAIFASLRDLERTISKKEEIQRAITNDKEGNVLSALSDVGFNDVLLVNDFPLATVALGYSRLKSAPPAWLNSFPVQADYGSKIPIYSNCVTSEALMMQMSALKVLSWLKANDFVSPEETTDMSEAEATLWLNAILSKAEPSVKEKQVIDRLYGLLHSYSHQCLQLLGTISGLEASSMGELLLPQTMSFIIYAGDTQIGGISAVFSQGMQMFTGELKNYLRTCKFDPSCSRDDKGVCAGCLYVARGCSLFNDNLSRAYLFGGNLDNDKEELRVGFMDV